MIDFHAHILPKMDDGVQSQEEAIKLLEEAKIAGFTKIIATSHYLEDTYESNEEERRELIETITKEGIEVVLGNEIYITDNIINLLKEKKASTINHSRYVLIEIPFYNNLIYFNSVIDKLKRGAYIPIMAHPERYEVVKKNPQIVEEWIERGIYIQSNYLSILGQYGKEAKKTIEILLRHKLIHFLGSDAHKVGQTYPEIQKAIKKIKTMITEEEFDTLSRKNAEKVLKNEDIIIEETMAIRKNILGKYK